MEIHLPEIEPELRGTIMGKVRLLMRSLGMGDKNPKQFFDALEAAGLQIDHKSDEIERLRSICNGTVWEDNERLTAEIERLRPRG